MLNKKRFGLRWLDLRFLLIKLLLHQLLFNIKVFQRHDFVDGVKSERLTYLGSRRE